MQSLDVSANAEGDVMAAALTWHNMEDAYAVSDLTITSTTAMATVT
jgi:hypothetical protein